jgi:hypothetical protein
MRLLRLSIEYDGRVVLSSVAALYALDKLVRRSETAATNIHTFERRENCGAGASPAIRKLGERRT